ncbi:ABC transporter ATP-binding protein [Thiorhodococcus mannitoliphagus]|uniref:ABC transporter ATP-binding protein n=1 Tax=Thiorhodococcus mannitoliphagus TaxID=329406 RepID=A0A6P1DVW1_9GAMM|nr:ABC transporter ATP-binding protein [Thiorhodococcus mannitoliphagus]NEX21829.1 ABC transporter ATP-binding protein [Thiorhodococcus mannitoliphagus]
MGHISVHNLGKAYKRYAHKWGRFAEWVGFGPCHQSHWVLRDINLAIAAGEAVGIIGVNGAGKSTLLKLITGTAHPTTGHIERGGSIAALLELGLGFHGEFTGRENVWTSALLAGLDSATIHDQMAEIEAFADIGDYIDQPVRTYSSGMQVRLAFAVATAVRPDILVVDEALAVGDVFFQQKCFERIRQYRDAGTTLLFVSHSMATVYTLCDRAVFIDGGRIRRDGPPREVIDIYNAHVANRLGSGDLEIAAGERGQSAGSYGRGDCTVDHVEILYQDQPVHTLISDSEMTVRIQVAFHRSVTDPHVGMQVRDRRGEAIYMTHTHGLGLRVGPSANGDRVEVSFSFRASLIPGDYTVTAGVADGGLPGGHVRTSLVRRHDAARFTVTEDVRGPRWDGICNLSPSCAIERFARRASPSKPRISPEAL